MVRRVAIKESWRETQFMIIHRACVPYFLEINLEVDPKSCLECKHYPMLIQCLRFLVEQYWHLVAAYIDKLVPSWNHFFFCLATTFHRNGGKGGCIE